MSKNPVYRGSNSRPNVSEGYEVTSELPGRTTGMFSRTLYAYRSLPSSCQLFFYPDANSILLRAHLCTAVEANSRDSIVVEDCFHGLVILGRRPFPMVQSSITTSHTVRPISTTRIVITFSKCYNRRTDRYCHIASHLSCLVATG